MAIVSTQCNLIEHSSEALFLAFSPDISRIISGSHRRSVLIWKTKLGWEVIGVMSHLIKVTSVAFSPVFSLHRVSSLFGYGIWRWECESEIF